MADPVYDDEGIDLVTLTFAVVLAAAIVFLLAQLVPQLVDLMMMSRDEPPPLSGTARGRFFCRGPRAWRNLQRGSTFLLRDIWPISASPSAAHALKILPGDPFVIIN